MFTPIIDRPVNGGGAQRIYRFPNDYGASVIRSPYSYTDGDEWEVAAIRFDGGGDDDWSLAYDTPVTSDVVGHVSPEALDGLLAEIADLPTPSAE